MILGKQLSKVTVVSAAGVLLSAAVCGAGHHGAATSQVDPEPGVAADMLDTMVVTAERVNEYISKHPGQVVVMNRDEFAERNILSVEEALGNMAGVDVKTSSGGGSRISIRGSGKSGSVLVLLNGRPLNSSQYGGVVLSTIAIDSVESITVFKPPIPAWLGPGGSEGAISITLREAVPEQDETGSTSKLRAVVGAFGRMETSLSHTTSYISNDRQAGFMATLEGMHSDGNRSNSDRDSGSLSLHWEQALDVAGEKNVEINGRYYAAEYGSAGPSDNPTPDARQDYRKVSLDTRLRGGLNLFDAAQDYSLSLYSDMVHLKDRSQSGLVSTLDEFKLGLKGQLNGQLNGKYTVAENGDGWGLRLSPLLEISQVDHTLSGSHERLVAGLGGQLERDWERVMASFGLRGDYTTDFGVNPGCSVSLGVDLTDRWNFSLSSGYTVKIPSFGQLYQPSHGSIDQARGNPDLNEERNLSSAINLKYQLDKINLVQLALFRTDSRDPIIYERGTDLIYRPSNGSESWRHGLELSAKYLADMDIMFDGSLILQDSGLNNSSLQQPYTPHVKGKLTVSTSLTATGTRLEAIARYNSACYSEAGNDEAQRIDAYTTVDVRVVQPFTLWAKPAEWFVTVENLLDEEYDIHYGYPDDGVRFLTGLTISL